MQNIISLLNEISVSIYLYLALLLSDYLETQIISTEGDDPFTVRTHLAWIITILLCSVILVNFLYTLVKKIIESASIINRKNRESKIIFQKKSYNQSQVVKMKPLCKPTKTVQNYKNQVDKILDLPTQNVDEFNFKHPVRKPVYHFFKLTR